MSWENNCRAVLDYLIARQADNPSVGPTMAIMPVSMYAGLMKISEEDALVWLTANAEYQGHGLWLITAKK